MPTYDYLLACGLVSEARLKQEEQENKKESSLIEFFRFDKEKNLLFIKFKTSEELYIYGPISPVVYTEFLKAESKGKFFNENIKNIFSFLKI